MHVYAHAHIPLQLHNPSPATAGLPGILKPCSKGDVKGQDNMSH